MIISKNPPPIEKEIEKAFGVKFDSGVAVAYGDTVHCIRGGISPALRVHEQVHLNQQKAIGSPEIWWEHYIKDPQFRLKQEIEAYQAQIVYLKKFTSNRKKLLNEMEWIWKCLSEMYGKNLITYKQAQELLPL